MHEHLRRRYDRDVHESVRLYCLRSGITASAKQGGCTPPLLHPMQFAPNLVENLGLYFPVGTWEDQFVVGRRD